MANWSESIWNFPLQQLKILNICTITLSMATKLDRVVTYHEGSDPWNHMTLWSCCLARSRDKLNSNETQTELHYQSVSDHQTWYDGSSPWWAATHKVTWLFDHVVLQDHVTNEIHYNSTTRVAITTKLGKMAAHLDGLLPIKIHYPLITWSCHITWQAKIIIYLLAQCLWPWNFVGWWLILKGS